MSKKIRLPSLDNIEDGLECWVFKNRSRANRRARLAGAKNKKAGGDYHEPYDKLPGKPPY